MASGADDGGGGGGPAPHGVGGERGVPPAAGPGGVMAPAPAPAPAPALHQGGGAPPVVQAAAAAASAAAADITASLPRGKNWTFEYIIDRFISRGEYHLLELYLKYLMQPPLHADTSDLEHVQIILNCRMAHVETIAKGQGYDSAYDYFQSQIKPLMGSRSPYANHGNIAARINWIESTLKENKPLVFDPATLKISISDYIRFYMPRQARYPESLRLRSNFYEFVFPVSQGKYRCLLCQHVWSSKPNSFLKSHFKGKEVCPNQTDHSKQRYNEFIHVNAKRKDDGSVSSNLKMKQVKVEQTEEDEELEDENLDMHQLISQGRSCIQNLAGPFVNQDSDAFAQVKKEMYRIFSSMENIWTSHNCQLPVTSQTTDPQRRSIQQHMYATQQSDMPESSNIDNQSSHFPADWDPAQFGDLPADWDSTQDIIWEEDFLPQNKNANTGSHVSRPSLTESVRLWEEHVADFMALEFLPLKENDKAAPIGDVVAATATEELTVSGAEAPQVPPAPGISGSQVGDPFSEIEDFFNE